MINIRQKAILWALTGSLICSLQGALLQVPAGYATIQSGIEAAAQGDTILVSPGRYFENLKLGDKSILITSLFLLSGNETHIRQTIIDGNAAGSVVTIKGETTPPITLSGFTLTNGLSNSGGGIFCQGASPRLQNLIITENNTSGWFSSGGGIYCSNSAPLISNVHITGNTANLGGGIFTNYANPVIENSFIAYNTVSGAKARGGGIFCGVNSTLMLKTVTVQGNLSQWHGGGIYCWTNAVLRLDHVAVVDNSASRWGAEGGGIYFSGAAGRIDHLTLSGNSATRGGALACENADLELVNSIVWGNTPGDIFSSPTDLPSRLLMAASDLEEGTDYLRGLPNLQLTLLGGTIRENPRFVDPDYGDYALQDNSPAIDCGVEKLVYAGRLLTDHRLDEYKGLRPDLGAFEFDPGNAPGIVGDLNRDAFTDIRDLVRLIDLIIDEPGAVDMEKLAEKITSRKAEPKPAETETADAFSSLRLQLNIASNLNRSGLDPYWRNGGGVEISGEMPFYFGRVQGGLQLLPYYSRNSSIPDFYTGLVYLGWGYEWRITPKLYWYNFMRLGNTQMTFDDPNVNAALRTESELSTSAGSRLTLPLTKQITANISVNYLVIHTHKPINLFFVSGGLGYTLQTPAWVQNILN
ncbi:MAG: hypothetical protein GXO91_08760 [FCB group bacterium]|nr:hypothetical protein [FCB group bacterium]